MRNETQDLMAGFIAANHPTIIGRFVGGRARIAVITKRLKAEIGSKPLRERYKAIKPLGSN